MLKMNWVSLKKLTVCVGLAPMLAVMGLAQQPIIFSKPAADAQPKPDNTSTAEPRHEVRSLFSSASSIFEIQAPTPAFAPLGISSAQNFSPAQQKAWDKELENKKKWTLMTPEEILGIPTPEKILGLPEKGGGEKLTAEQRFLRRYDQLNSNPSAADKAYSRTKQSTEPLLRNNESPFARKNFESVFAPIGGKNTDDSSTDASRNESRSEGKGASFIGSLVNPTFFSADHPDTRWGNVFNLPTPPPKANPEQLAGMDRFRESLQPSVILQKSAETFRSPAAAAPVRDPFMNAASDFNPRGSSFAPLRSDVTRPRGLTPLPGIATRVPLKPTRSAQTSLPPWMRDDSEAPVGVPIRKF